jgi:para-aminobenzoate synthetase component 1
LKSFSQIETIDLMNKLGQENRPFLFIISYNLEANLVIPLNELDKDKIQFDFSGKRNSFKRNFKLSPYKIDFKLYKNAFSQVKENLLSGNSFLTNLTVSTPVSPTLDLWAIYQNANAKYKLWITDQLACFSPETFVTVTEKGGIATFPMKGTIDASLPNAENVLKSDKKELYEHTTIVDLLRNDLSKVADTIKVERFQYIDKITKEDGSQILQMSSEIRGQLPENWRYTLGDWFFELLPAGSICGAPKAKTLQIIEKAEKDLHLNGSRGFYTGVCGVFDGQTLNSAVMIRFIDKTQDGYVFKSGGGITHLSNVEKEYEEIYQKLYVPVG